MAKNNFNPDAAFKKIVSPNQEEKKGKGRPKENRETKKVKSITIFPSVYENIQKIAYIERRSLSDVVGELLEKYVNENTDKIEEYDIIKKK